MPRFFFHVHNGNGETPDEVGSELESQTAALQLAVDSVRSIVAEEARSGLIDLDGHIAVEDDAANRLLTVKFSDAFELRMPGPRSGPQG